MEIRAVSGPWYDGIEFQIRTKTEDNRLSVVNELTFHAVAPNAHSGMTGCMSREAAQVLMDDLWAAGLRPTEGSGSAGSLRATEKHLEDMRSIVAKKLEVSFG